MIMTVRPMLDKDRDRIIKMMTEFYSSPAVHTNGSLEIFERDIDNCTNSSPYLEGYVFDENGTVCGYAMLAKSFSTEFGKPCIWVEDLFISSEHRGHGIGVNFLSFVSEKYPDAVIRLEVEDENTHAVHVYEKSGFERMPYVEMIKL